MNGKDDIPYMENKSHVPNHQPAFDWLPTGFNEGYPPKMVTLELGCAVHGTVDCGCMQQIKSPYNGSLWVHLNITVTYMVVS
jgi:hypothetical protein